MSDTQTPVTFIIYAAVTDQSIRTALGKAEYSYYFLFKAFRPVLDACGEVVIVTSPQDQVDTIYDQCIAAGRACVFISFTPPNLTPIRLRCPTIAVFAWEFDSLPDGAWSDNPAENWEWALAQHAGAIVCSQHTATIVREALGADYPVTSLPAPVWDRFAPLYQESRARQPLSLTVRGFVYDSATVVFDVNNLFPARFRHYYPASYIPPEAAPHGVEQDQEHHIIADGTIYTSVFNPADGRKAWFDIVTAFCYAFREQEDAVLLLKMSHTDPDSYRHNLNHMLHQLAPFKCRVIAFNGFLEADVFDALVRATAFYVNASHCEGLCLPLLEFMSAGVPAIAPDHTAMADYIRPHNAYVIPSSEEINIWPNDTSSRYRTRRYRNSWDGLRSAFSASLHADRIAGDRISSADQDLQGVADYRQLSRSAYQDMKAFCSLHSATQRLRQFLTQLGIAHLAPNLEGAEQRDSKEAT